MINTTDLIVLIGIMSPVYAALAGIYLKIGKFDEVCDEVRIHICDKTIHGG